MPATVNLAPDNCNFFAMVFHSVSHSALEQYRQFTYRLSPELRLRDADQALEFVNQRGFVFFWPIKGYELPSLWVATAGDRLVPNNHNDPGHVTWGWKDTSLGKRRWFYAKVLRKKSTMISLETLPYFYALSENYGSPEEDHLILYEQGRMSAEARAIYEALLDEGPLDSVSLRKATRLASQENASRFERALTELQADFKIMPVGVAQAGAWRYAFVYEIVARHHPEILGQAQIVGEQVAYQHLLELYFTSVGIATPEEISRLFGWPPKQTRTSLEKLVASGTLSADVRVNETQQSVYALTSLVDITKNG
jgi:hypothetical protein